MFLVASSYLSMGFNGFSAWSLLSLPYLCQWLLVLLALYLDHASLFPITGLTQHHNTGLMDIPILCTAFPQTLFVLQSPFHSVWTLLSFPPCLVMFNVPWLALKEPTLCTAPRYYLCWIHWMVLVKSSSEQGVEQEMGYIDGAEKGIYTIDLGVIICQIKHN